MKKIKLLILLLVPLILSGCYNYRELNDLGIMTAVSIDYDAEKDNFNIIAQLVNPVKQQDTTSIGEPIIVNFESSAKSVQEAFRNIIVESPRKIYGSHLQIVILSEEVAREHLPEVLDFIIRDPELRAEFKVIIARNNESLKGISIQTLLDNLSSSNILESLEKQSEYLGISSSYTVNELANMYLNPYLEITLPSMIVEGSIKEGEEHENITTTTQDTTVKISTTAVFKDNKIKGYLTEDEAKAFNLITGELKDSIITMEREDGYIVFEPNRIKTKTKAKVAENKVSITVEGFARINEVASIVNLKSPDEINSLEKELNKKIENMINNTFKKIRDEYQTDVFGFQDLYYKTDHKYFKENCQNWYEDIFPNLNIEVEAKLKLYEKGNTLGGIEYEGKN